MKEDRLLIQGIRQRKGRELELVIEKYGQTVYALSSRILSNLGQEDDVEECVSDAFLAVWERIGEYDPARGSFRTWILILAKYQALDCRRCLMNSREHVDAVSPGLPDLRSEDEFCGVEIRQELLAALRALNDLDRELVYRRYYLFEGISQLAGDYGMTERAVYNRLWRARKVMREQLTPTRKEEVKP